MTSKELLKEIKKDHNSAYKLAFSEDVDSDEIILPLNIKEQYDKLEKDLEVLGFIKDHLYKNKKNESFELVLDTKFYRILNEWYENAMEDEENENK